MPFAAKRICNAQPADSRTGLRSRTVIFSCRVPQTAFQRDPLLRLLDFFLPRVSGGSHARSTDPVHNPRKRGGTTSGGSSSGSAALGAGGDVELRPHIPVRPPTHWRRSRFLPSEEDEQVFTQG
jgi:hypothetical protein